MSSFGINRRPDAASLRRGPCVRFGDNLVGKVASTTSDDDSFSLEKLTKPDKELQRRFPGHYAHLAPPLPFSKVGPSIVDIVNGIGKQGHHVPAKDHELANLNSVGTLAGSGLIATLATLGMNRRILGVPEFLGVMSWFAAMSVTPKIIDGMVYLKTGVNVQQLYDSSYGERKSLFTDPHYLPLYLLSDRTINQVANRLHIPPDVPNRRERVEDKMRQVSVQAHTWWMLVAGPSAAMLSGLMCDALQDRALGGINQLRKHWIAQSPFASEASPEAMLRKADAALACWVGLRAESDLSMWWKSFGHNLVLKTRLQANPRIRLPLAGYEPAAQEVTRHFADMAGKQAQLNAIQEFLKEQRAALNAIQENAEKIVASLNEGDAKNKRSNWLAGRILNAVSTLDHYDALMRTLRREPASKPLSESALRVQMEANLPILQSLMQNGFREEAIRLAGGEKTFREIVETLQIEKSAPAVDRMGAAPIHHLIQSVQESLLRARWQNRMIWGLGIALLSLTALYTGLFVGRDFPEKRQGGGV